MKYATYSKSIYDGGRREKNIANKYYEYAENIVDDYPVTAEYYLKYQRNLKMMQNMKNSNWIT